MASKYWLKLFHETIYDPKIMMRSPGARLRWYECLCLAGDNDKDGELPPIEHMVYVFRITEEQLIKELQELVETGLLTREESTYSITNWHTRQAAMDTNERSTRYRETVQKREYYEPATELQQTGNDNTTVRDADIDIDIDKEIDKKKIRFQKKASTPKKQRDELISRFKEKTGLDYPEDVPASTLQKFWWSPASDMVSYAGGVDEAWDILRQLIERFDDKGLVFADINSFSKSFNGMIAQKKRGGGVKSFRPTEENDPYFDVIQR